MEWHDREYRQQSKRHDGYVLQEVSILNLGLFRLYGNRITVEVFIPVLGVYSAHLSQQELMPSGLSLKANRPDGLLLRLLLSLWPSLL